MAVPFLSSIKLNKNQVEDFCIYNLANDPSPTAGADFGYFWLNTGGSKSLRWWDGTTVRTILDSASTISVADNLSGGVKGSLPYQNAVNDTTFLGIGTSGQVLSVATDVPAWVNQSSLSVGSATNKPGGALGDILVQSGSGTTTFLNVGTVGQVLTSNGASPAYVNQSSLSVGSATTATTATNVAGGAAGELLYQSGLATTAKLGVGTDGYILTYDGTNTKPKWSASIPAGSVSGLAASATTDTTNAANISSGLLPLARLALATGQFYVGDASNNPAATAKSSISLTGFGALTADLDIAGFNIINSGNVTSGSSGSTLATKGYVDSVAQGLDIKASCLVASTADINLSAPGSGLIDGIDPATFTSGTTRILVKDQSLSQQNGIYIWNGTGSAMTRSLDANTWDELVGAFTFVERGNDNADSGWVCNVNAGGTLGTTAVTWTKFSQAGAYDAGNGMVLSGGKFYFAQTGNYTEGQIPYASSTTAIGFKSVTGTGDVVLATSPTLVTPALGTPTSGNLSSCTGLSLTTGVSGTLPVGNGGTGATTFTAGQVLFGNGTSAINSSSNLFWDNGNSRLGIGTATPAYPLSVNGRISYNGAIGEGADTTLSSSGTSLLHGNSATWTQQVFYTGGTTKLTLDTNGYLYTAANGRIGVGISPIAPLHVYVAGASERASILAHMGGGDEAFRLVARNGSGGAVGNVESARFGLERDAVWNAGFRFFRGGSGTDGYLIASTSGTDRLTLDSSGNLGLGVTPKVWYSGYKSIQVGQGPCITGYASAGNESEIFFGANAYVGASGASWQYLANGQASQYWQKQGNHYWRTAANNTSGADANISWGDPKMTLDASGNLGVGATTPVQPLEINKSSSSTALTSPPVAGSTIRVRNTSNTDNAFSSLEFYNSAGLFGGSVNCQFVSQATPSNDLVFVTRGSSGGLESLRITSAGSTLSGVNGTASNPSFSRIADPNTGLYFPTGNDTLALAVGGSDAVYIDSSRNVGLGTIPGHRLDIRDNSTGLLARLSSTSTGGCSMQFVSTSTNGRTYRIGSNYVSGSGEFSIYDDTAGLERLRIKSTGQLNLTGLASAPTGAVGDLYYNSATDSLQLYSGAWNTLTRKISAAGVGTGATITVTHNWGTRDVLVQVRNNSHAQVLTDVTYGEDSVTVTFADSNTTLSNYTVTVIG